MISVQRDLKHSIFNVRLHHLFVSAPEPILRYLGEYIVKNDRLASKKLNVFIDQHHEKIRLARSRENRLSIQTAGRFYDLQEIFNKLNAQYFGGKVRSRITWGKSVCMGKARRSIKVGSFHVEVKLIRIHPGLDQEWIPYFYIEWVVYHEMLHALHPIPVVQGRRRFHTKEFSKDEQRFSEYASAIEWEKRNIAALLCL